MSPPRLLVDVNFLSYVWNHLSDEVIAIPTPPTTANLAKVVIIKTAFILIPPFIVLFNLYELG